MNELHAVGDQHEEPVGWAGCEDVGSKGQVQVMCCTLSKLLSRASQQGV